MRANLHEFHCGQSLRIVLGEQWRNPAGAYDEKLLDALGH